MTPAHATKNGSKRYRYYTCSSAQRRGRDTCPTPSLPAAEIERLVLEQLQTLNVNAAAQQPPLSEPPLEEQQRLVRVLVQRVDYHGAWGKLTIRLNPDALQALAEKSASQAQEEQQS